LKPAVKALTFDLWDTIFIDDSDEPKRAAQGLRPKSEQRPYAIFEALKDQEGITWERSSSHTNSPHPPLTKSGMISMSPGLFVTAWRSCSPALG